MRNKINENVERKIAATERLSRIEIRAPVSGKVHQLNVFTDRRRDRQPAKSPC